MILQRLATAIREQNWFTVLIETLIVVLGVFLGLQLGNWNQYSNDRQAETSYLLQLRGDLKNIGAEIDAQIAFEQFQATLANDVFELIQTDASPDRGRKINTGLSQLTERRTLRTESPTFLDLQGAGRLEIISDTELRAAIISYFYGSSRLEAALDKNNAFYVDQNYVKFVSNAGIPARDWDDALMQVQLPYSAASTSDFTETALNTPLFAASSTHLGAPPDAEIWDETIVQLNWRGYVSIANESHAQRMRAATADLEQKLAARLDGETP
ncbi:MAG: hypothetical protein RLN72_15165 [Henriciella sp.]